MVCPGSRTQNGDEIPKSRPFVGSLIRFKNLSEGYCEVGSNASATLDLGRIAGEIETGLIHIDDDANELPENLDATDRPLNEPLEREFCPRSKLLASVK